MSHWNGPQPAPLALRHLIYANLPQIHRMGIYNVRNIAGSSKQSLHSEGRAADIYLSAFVAVEKALADRLFAVFVDCARSMGLEEVIWNHQIWSHAKSRAHRYTGVNPHTDHVHVGFTRPGSQLVSLGTFPMRLAQMRSEMQDVLAASSNLA